MKYPNRVAAALLLSFVTVLAFAVGPVSAATYSSGDQMTLYAGQDTPVGTVTVTDDGTHLTVLFETDPGWLMTETHLAVGDSVADVPTNRKGNPKIGQFPYSAEHDPAVDTVEYEIPLSWVPNDGDLTVAAHAVVVQGLAPYYPGDVVSFEQGTKKDGSDVRAGRSDPAQGLVFEAGASESNFVSLGFDDPETEAREGVIVVGFDVPVANGTGDDLRVIEDTWGTYPDEVVEVYVSQDGSTWHYLGLADNSRSLDPIHTVTAFDLGTVGLDHVSYVKLVDVTDPADHNDNADGYDLNAVEALHSNPVYETAWADGMEGTPFVQTGGSWATYFEYVLD